MRKLNCLLIAFAIFAVACENSFDEQSKNQITLSSKTIEVHFESNEHTINVTSPYSWIAESNNDWISLTCDNGIAGTEELRFVCDRNIEETERQGTIVIKNEKFNLYEELHITQKAFEPKWYIGTEVLNFAVDGGAQEIDITANFQYDVKSDVNWLTIEKRKNILRITAQPTTALEIRTAEIIILNEKYGLAKKICVLQEAISYAIFYTSSDDRKVTPYSESFNDNDTKIVSNIYLNGQGVIIFDTPVTSIGYKAFYCCDNLTSITIPDSVTKIGSFAFSDCSSLTSITIPDSVTKIGSHIFSGCTSLTSVTIGNGVTSTGNNTFRNCTSLTSITIGNGVTSIGDESFIGCTSLESITIPDSVTTIASHAFYHCSCLTNIIIPDSVTEIRSSAFSYCSSLTSITIPDSVTSIGERSFFDCRKLTSITIGNGVISIGSHAFEYCSSLNSITIGNSVASIGYQAFSGCSSLTSITIPNSVTSIGDYAFFGCTSELIINSKIVETDYTSSKYPMHNSYGWLYGSKFTKLTIGDNITKIGDYAFYVCSSLISVTIGSGVISIGDSAFEKCHDLTSVTIGNSVTSIGNYAFSGCGLLTNVFCRSTTPPTGGYGMFFYNSSGRKIYVLPNSVEAYRLAKYWSDYADYIVGYDFE